MKKELIQIIYGDACAKGFHTEYKSDQHWLIMVITEVAEAIEADRQNRYVKLNPTIKAVFKDVTKSDEAFIDRFQQYIKNHVEDGVDVYCQTFILKSANADSAKKQIELYMARKAKERAETGKEAIICKYGITINAASPVGIGSVVPENFSMAYKHAESDFAKEVEKKDSKEEDEDENSEE